MFLPLFRLETIQVQGHFRQLDRLTEGLVEGSEGLYLGHFWRDIRIETSFVHFRLIVCFFEECLTRTMNSSFAFPPKAAPENGWLDRRGFRCRRVLVFVDLLMASGREVVSLWILLV